MCVVALEVFVQARGVLLKMSVGHGDDSIDRNREKVNGLDEKATRNGAPSFLYTFICGTVPDAGS